MAIPISARWNLKWLGFFCWQKGDISNKCPLRSIWGWLLRGPYPKATLIFRMILGVCRIFLRMAACFSYSYPKNPLGDTRMEGWSVIFEGSEDAKGIFFCGATGLLVLGGFKLMDINSNLSSRWYCLFPFYLCVPFCCGFHKMVIWICVCPNLWERPKSCELWLFHSVNVSNFSD